MVAIVSCELFFQMNCLLMRIDKLLYQVYVVIKGIPTFSDWKLN